MGCDHEVMATHELPNGQMCAHVLRSFLLCASENLAMVQAKYICGYGCECIIGDEMVLHPFGYKRTHLGYLEGISIASDGLKYWL